MRHEQAFRKDCFAYRETPSGEGLEANEMKRLFITLRAYARVSSLDQDLALQDIVHELKGRKRGAESH
jgi:hypothetical protein